MLPRGTWGGGGAPRGTHGSPGRTRACPKACCPKARWRDCEHSTVQGCSLGSGSCAAPWGHSAPNLGANFPTAEPLPLLILGCPRCCWSSAHACPPAAHPGTRPVLHPQLFWALSQRCENKTQQKGFSPQKLGSSLPSRGITAFQLSIFLQIELGCHSFTVAISDISWCCLCA